MDESGLTVVHRPGKVLSKCRQKQVGKTTSDEKGQTTTVICAISASGFYVPPMLIFKWKRFTELLLRGSPPGTVGACSANGWVDSELFIKWLVYFIAVIKSTLTKKFLIVDGLSSHKTLAATELARNNGCRVCRHIRLIIYSRWIRQLLIHLKHISAENVTNPLTCMSHHPFVSMI